MSIFPGRLTVKPPNGFRWMPISECSLRAEQCFAVTHNPFHGLISLTRMVLAGLLLSSCWHHFYLFSLFWLSVPSIVALNSPMHFKAKIGFEYKSRRPQFLRQRTWIPRRLASDSNKNYLCPQFLYQDHWQSCQRITSKDLVGQQLTTTNLYVLKQENS